MLLLGYVEDPLTGKSFSFPHGTSWKIYIEVIIKFMDNLMKALLYNITTDIFIAGL